MNGQGLTADTLVGLLSIYLGVRNLTENEQQSDAQLKILQQIDVGAANDRQAAYLLEELGRKFDEQNQMLKRYTEIKALLETARK